MSEQDSKKNYYWRRDKDFHNRHDIQLMMRQKGFGHDAVLIYEILCDHACVHHGKLRYNKEIPYTQDDLKQITGDWKTFNKAYEYMLEKGLLQLWEDGTYYVEYADKMSGSEVGRTRRRRENEVTNCHQESDKMSQSGCQKDAITTTTTITKDITITKDKTTTTNSDKSGGGKSMPIYDLLEPSDVQKLKERFKDHLRLIREVNDEVYKSDRKVDNAFAYIVGYAKKCNWEENDAE